MSRVSAVKNAFKPRPPGPVVKFTPEEIVNEEVRRVGEPRNKDALRVAVEKWIDDHPRQRITAREIRSALSIPSRNMSAVRTIGEALRRLCQRVGKGQRGVWVYRPGRQEPRRQPAPSIAEVFELFEIVIGVSIRPRLRREGGA